MDTKRQSDFLLGGTGLEQEEDEKLFHRLQLGLDWVGDRFPLSACHGSPLFLLSSNCRQRNADSVRASSEHVGNLLGSKASAGQKRDLLLLLLFGDQG
jgi:hypothetical protein